MIRLLTLCVIILLWGIGRAQGQPNLDQNTQELLGYKGVDIPETKLNNEQIIQNNTNILYGNSESLKIIEGALNKASEVDIDSQSHIFDRAKHYIKKPEEKIDWLKDAQNQCIRNTNQNDINYVQEVICDEYNTLNKDICTLNQKIDVTEKHDYQCKKVKTLTTSICEKTLKTWCEYGNECDAGGIKVDTISGDMVFNYQYPYLTIGTVADDYWKGYCAVFDRKVTFTIKNLDRIKEFVLEQVGYDDYMLLKLNGAQVFNGPFGGAKLEVKNAYNRNIGIIQHVTTDGRNAYPCERGISHNYAVNIDLKPILREGINIIEMRVIVSGAGEGWFRIRTKQQCCIPQTKWEVKCDK